VIAKKRAEAVIPSSPSRSRKYPLDAHLRSTSPRRMLHLQVQAVPTRCHLEKTAQNYLAIITIVAIAYGCGKCPQDPGASKARLPE
jgi:hypothetical protein